MRYIIYGAGAVGGVIGGRLFQHGHEVVLIARGPHLTAIRETGLVLRSPAGTVALPVPAIGHPAEVTFRDDDVVLLTMKTQDTEAALSALRSAAGAGVPVICAQNGVENERLALRRFERVYGMVVILPAVHLEPGVVEANSVPVSGILDAGRYPSGTDALVTEVAAGLSASSFDARADGDIMRLKYGKLLSNLANAVQAACGPGADAAELVRQVRTEALECYRAAGIAWASEEEMRERRGNILQLGRVEGEARQGGSSWQSLARGAGSIESDFLNGEIALLGRLHGVATPANALLQEVADQMVRDGRKPGSIAVEELRSALAGAKR